LSGSVDLKDDSLSLPCLKQTQDKMKICQEFALIFNFSSEAYTQAKPHVKQAFNVKYKFFAIINFLFLSPLNYEPSFCAHTYYTYFREFVTGIFMDDPGKSTSSSTRSNGICRGILIIDVILTTGYSRY
jgi:hypothetical protein